MKMVETYASLGIHAPKNVFEYLLANLKDTIRTYDFYVAWDNVLSNVSHIEVALNILNSLIGKNDIATQFKKLIKSYPEIVPVIPLLIAVRDRHIRIADMCGDIEYSFAKRTAYTDEEITQIAYFAEKCGLLQVLSDKSIKNLVDYAIGVEVGLDTNARKNRSGDVMESLVEVYIKDICDRHAFRYLRQATVAKIKTAFGKDVNTDTSARHFDFAIDTPNKLYVCEVNYYGGGGSKLKAVAGEFKGLSALVCDAATGFIWMPDGQGWLTAHHPLLETYNATDFVINLKMIESGVLEEIVTKGL